MTPEYSEKHSGETLDLTGQRIQDAQFHDCTIRGLRRAWLIDCDMTGSSILIDNPVDFLDVTLTLSCYTFKDVELSETMFDALVYLISLGRGNDRKRQTLREMVEPARLRLFERVFPDLIAPR